MSPRPIGVSCDTWTLSPISRSVAGTCSDRSRPSRSHGLSAATASTSVIGGLLGRVGLEQRARQNLVDPQRAAADGDVAGDARRLEAALQLEARVDVDRAELVAHHLEVARGAVDLQIADAQLVGAEAAVNVERAAVGVLEVQRLDRDALAAPASAPRACSCSVDAGRRRPESRRWRSRRCRRNADRGSCRSP